MDGSSQYFLPTLDGLERVRHERYAFHCDGMTAFPLIHETFDPYEICDLNMVRKCIMN